MAKIESVHPTDEHSTEYTETIETRIWGECGTEDQPFYIGSGLNFQANGNLWLEIYYTVNGAQVFYTRSFLQHHPYRSEGFPTAAERLDEIVQKGEGVFGFGDMLPDTSLVFTLEKFTYEDENDVEKQGTRSSLKISADTGAVFGRTGPGMYAIDIKLRSIAIEEGARFMRELIDEIEAAHQGKHPDPATFAPGSSNWPFVWQLNQPAYDKISEDYQEAYFDNPLLTEAFDGWLAQLPPGGHILDAGCGHGKPVIDRLLEKDFQVTGSDFSPAMLRLAGEQFPQAAFINKATTMLEEQAIFDGICSFNSLLYLDLIDFLNSVTRLHAALKPGGLLFLFGCDSGPDWRGEPLRYTVGQWMWCWHYGEKEAAKLLEEHGYFEVLDTRTVRVDPNDAKRIAEELEKQKQQEEEFNQRKAEEPDSILSFMPFFKTPIERAPYDYVIIARKCERG